MALFSVDRAEIRGLSAKGFYFGDQTYLMKDYAQFRGNLLRSALM
jgi:hypothetical protein